MRVLIFGLGILGGGFAAATYFLDRGGEVRITDLRDEKTLGEPVEILKKRGATIISQVHREEDFLWADLVIKNPAVSPDNPYLALATQVVTDISFLLTSPIITSIPIIVVTGTKGKTTTVAAVTHALNSLGEEAIQFGNMGISGFSVLADLERRIHSGQELPKYLLCELSSWQIRDLYTIAGKSLPHFKIILLTSLFPDHLNKYKDYQAYKEDKWLLFNSSTKRMIVPQKVYDEIITTLSLKPRNIRTIESFSGIEKQKARLQPAWAVCRSLGMGSKQITAAFTTFRGVPHRQEQLGMKNQVVFINDSAATIPEAVAFTCANSPWSFHLICGGTDKNLEAHGMLEALKVAKGIHLLGGSFTTNKLIPLLEQEEIPYSGPFSSMEEAVASAYKDAKTDLAIHHTVAVFLSPGAASFGMFRHEFDRGDQFREIVKNLE